MSPRWVRFVLDTLDRQRLADIATGGDPLTIEQLSWIGVGRGWRCAEVGAGAGTIAAWFSDHVGEEGLVVATDIDTR
jgi:tRNA A58 N-methylase Trm61